MQKFYTTPIALGSQYILTGPVAMSGTLDFATNIEAADTATEVLRDLYWLWTQVFRR